MEQTQRRLPFRETLPPQEQLILRHLVKHGSITDEEARTVHRVRSLSRRITTLFNAGVGLWKEYRKDFYGQRYVRYHYVSHPPELDHYVAGGREAA